MTITYQSAQERRLRYVQLSERDWDTLSSDEKSEKINIESSPSYGSIMLEGSEKQISWAVDIRDGMMCALDNYIKEGFRQATNKQVSDAELAKMQQNVDRAITNLMNQPSARWWIDNRELSSEKLFQEAYWLTAN